MGSRYGGLKQIDPVDHDGDLIIDFSIFDAKEAGFEKVVFIIKKAIEKDFREHIGNRMEKHIQVEYVYQENDLLPEGYQVPENRVKPWGTGHAILCCKDVIDGPFAVINADDYYGKAAFKELYRHLCETEDNDRYQYAMVGYKLYNTLTENGHVSRGVCVADEHGYLADIHERTRVEKHGDKAEYTEDNGRFLDVSAGGYPGIHEYVGLYLQHSRGAGEAVYCIFRSEPAGQSGKMRILPAFCRRRASEGGQGPGDCVKERRQVVRRYLQGRQAHGHGCHPGPKGQRVLSEKAVGRLESGESEAK